MSEDDPRLAIQCNDTVVCEAGGVIFFGSCVSITCGAVTMSAREEHGMHSACACAADYLTA